MIHETTFSSNEWKNDFALENWNKKKTDKHPHYVIEKNDSFPSITNYSNVINF